MIRERVVSLLTCIGVGLYASIALGSINYAAHVDAWGLRAMYALSGLYAGVSAARLAGTRRAVRAEAGSGISALVIAGFLIPFAARPEGATLWTGGAWIGALGAAVALASSLALGSSFGLAPAARGTVARGPYAAVRHPMAASFIVLAVGFLLIRFSPWNLAVMGSAAVMVVVAAFLEERVLRRDPDYLDYALRVPSRFVPGVI